MTTPVRLQLSRQKGFDLQAHSLAVNGLPAVKVSRPGPFGNPFSIAAAAEAYDCRAASAHGYAVEWFREWVAAKTPFEPLTVWDGTQQQHDRLHARLPELRGKNLACFCKPEFACHADVLLDLANRPLSNEEPIP